MFSTSCINLNESFRNTKWSNEKIPIRLVGTGIWARDLPNKSPVYYNCATSLGYAVFVSWNRLILYRVNDFATSVLMIKIFSLIWLTLSKYFLFSFFFSNLFCSEFSVYFNSVFVIGSSGLEVVCIGNYFLFLGGNSRWNQKYYSVRNGVCTTYSFENQLPIYFWIQESPVYPERLFHDDQSQRETLKITGVELGLDCFSQGSFPWCVSVVSSPQNLVILTPSSEMVKNTF